MIDESPQFTTVESVELVHVLNLRALKPNAFIVNDSNGRVIVGVTVGVVVFVGVRVAVTLGVGVCDEVTLGVGVCVFVCV